LTRALKLGSTGGIGSTILDFSSFSLYSALHKSAGVQEPLSGFL